MFSMSFIKRVKMKLNPLLLTLIFHYCNALCQDGCCIESLNLSLTLLDHKITAPALFLPPNPDKPTDGHLNADVGIITDMNDGCLQCHALPSTCPWADMKVHQYLDVSQDKEVHAKVACGQSIHVMSGDYFCAAQNNNAETLRSKTLNVVEEKVCGLPPVLSGGVLTDFQWQQSGGYKVTHSCASDTKTTTITRCEREHGGVHSSHIFGRTSWVGPSKACSEPQACQDSHPAWCKDLSLISCEAGWPMHYCQRSCDRCVYKKAEIIETDGVLQCVVADVDGDGTRKRRGSKILNHRSDNTQTLDKNYDEARISDKKYNDVLARDKHQERAEIRDIKHEGVRYKKQDETLTRDKKHNRTLARDKKHKLSPRLSPLRKLLGYKNKPEEEDFGYEYVIGKTLKQTKDNIKPIMNDISSQKTAKNRHDFDKAFKQKQYSAKTLINDIISEAGAGGRGEKIESRGDNFENGGAEIRKIGSDIGKRDEETVSTISEENGSRARRSGEGDEYFYETATEEDDPWTNLTAEWFVNGVKPHKEMTVSPTDRLTCRLFGESVASDESSKYNPDHAESEQILVSPSPECVTGNSNADCRLTVTLLSTTTSKEITTSKSITSVIKEVDTTEIVSTMKIERVDGEVALDPHTTLKSKDLKTKEILQPTTEKAAEPKKQPRPDSSNIESHPDPHETLKSKDFKSEENRQSTSKAAESIALSRLNLSNTESNAPTSPKTLPTTSFDRVQGSDDNSRSSIRISISSNSTRSISISRSSSSSSSNSNKKDKNKNKGNAKHRGEGDSGSAPAPNTLSSPITTIILPTLVTVLTVLLMG